jgi:hypothetical protein
VLPNLRPKKFSVAIAPKTPSIRSRVSPKETKSTENQRAREILETKNPVVTSGTVDEDKRVSETACGDTITKENVNMNNVKVERLFTVDGFSARSFRNRREGTKRDLELATIHPLTIEAGLKDMLVVAETATAEGTMKLFRGPVSFSVGAIRTIARTNRRRNGTGTMNKPNDILLRER